MKQSGHMAEQNLSKKLKYLRMFNNMTFKELSERVGASQSTLSNIERGKNTPRVGLLFVIAQHFNVSVDWLLSDEDSEPFLTSATDNLDLSHRSQLAKKQNELIENQRELTELKSDLLRLTKTTECNYNGHT